MKTLFFLLLFCLPFFSAHSQVTIHVPADQPTIQAGIDVAKDGDLVLVADGTYFENLNYNGKAITIASNFLIDGNRTHIENTIIDGSQCTSSDTCSVVVFLNGEDTTSVLCGFTITGGTGTFDSEFPTWAREGGGILTSGAGAKIVNNIITGNTAIQGFAGQYNVCGGGICASPAPAGKTLIIQNNVIEYNYVEGQYYSFGAGIAAWPDAYNLISNNVIMDNTLSSPYAEGGGLYVPVGQPQIINNYFYNNLAISQSSSTVGGGGGIYVINNAPTLINNLIVNNEGTQGGGIKIYNCSNCVIENNTILNNTAPGLGGGIRNYNTSTEIINSIVWGNDGQGTEDQLSGSTYTVTYTDVQGGYTGIGNIDENPLFISSEEFYLLQSSSPCIDAGNPDTQYNDVEFPIGSGNPLYPAQGSLSNDMGHCGGPTSLWGYWEWPIPVELTSFTVSTSQGKVTLNWSTATETNNSGFEIQIRLDNSEWKKIGFTAGHGTTAKPKEYSYVDDISSITANSLAYRLKQIDYDGTYEYSDEVFVDNPAPSNYALQQNYPNPFNPNTKIKYSVPQSSNVLIKVFDILGNEIETLVNEEKSVGTYEVEFSVGQNSILSLSSGIYFYQLRAGSPSAGSGQNFIETKKMILLK